MNIILLSGGSGKRLWPLSNDIRSKQFIKIFKNRDGEYESMVQRMYRSIRRIDRDANVVIATSKSQASELKNQLGDDIHISVEPERRDTFPAIALAVSYLHDVMGVKDDESIIICPVDPYVEDDYFEALKQIDFLSREGKANLTLMGMEPTYPSEKYGYIIPMDDKPVSMVSCFKEKPDEKTAETYISQGALWNAGIFAFRLGWLLKKAHELLSFKDYRDLFCHFSEARKISFDYAVVEHEKDIQVLRFSGMWKDLGTWNTLVESMHDDTYGNVILSGDCKNVHVVNSMNLPVVVVNQKDLIVATSREGILITDEEGSTHIKSIVESLDSRVMFAEKSWGEFEVIDEDKDSLTLKLSIKKDHSMSYHCHQERDEIWMILSGNGLVTLDGEQTKVHKGDTISIKKGTMHKINALTDLKLIEIQIGYDIDVKDKLKEESK